MKSLNKAYARNSLIASILATEAPLAWLLSNLDLLKLKVLSWVPIETRNKQISNFLGIKASNGAGKEKEPERDYILLPLWTADSPFFTTLKSSQDNEFQPSNDGAKKVDKDLRKENKCNDQREEDSTNSTNRFNTVTSNINAASSSRVNIQCCSPLPAQVYSPPKKDMSWTGLPEFADDTITDYSRPLPSIESNTSDLQNINSSVYEHGESSDSIMSKTMIKFVRAADSPEVNKTNQTETARKPPIKYAEMYRNTTKSPKVRRNQRNWNNLMNQRLGSNFEFKNKACYECGSFDHLIKDCCVYRKQEMEKPV
nr:retrotransposon Orf1 [Tanacetum cinerariifolium]